MSSACDKQVLALCEEVWRWRLCESPELATFCGFYQDEELWDDISSEAYCRREKCVRAFLDQALSFDVSNCSRDVALSYTLLTEDMRMYLQACVYPCHLMPINYLEGVHVECCRTVSFMKYDTEADFAKYIQRLKALPKKIYQTIELLKEGVRDGVVLFSSSVRNIPGQIGSMLKLENLDGSGLLKPFTEDHPTIPADKLNDLQNQAKSAIVTSIFPALVDLKNYLQQEYWHAVRTREGICCMENGTAWYQQCLNFHLSCHMAPREVHDIGLAEVARIRARILHLAEIEGLGQTFPDILKSLEQRARNFFNSKDEVMVYAKDICYNRIRPKLAKLFKNLPEVSLAIEEVPSHLKDSPAGYYFNGTADGSRQGCFYVNTHSFIECTSLPSGFPALCLHEGEPGHHLQDVYLLAATHLPDFRRYFENGKYYMMPRKFSTHSAYYEGWGLYSESLGEELNLYLNNLELLGRCGYEIFRATRLVVDTGLHAFGWSKEQALQYMVDNCLVDSDKLGFEIDRYINWPGQACAYKIGEMKIWELRRKAERELGAKFDIREFHHCILSCGAVPLDVLADIVDQFIHGSKEAVAETGTGAAYETENPSSQAV